MTTTTRSTQDLHAELAEYAQMVAEDACCTRAAAVRQMAGDAARVAREVGCDEGQVRAWTTREQQPESDESEG